MEHFAKNEGGDPRFAVLPGVLHSEPIWGNGTTEYALDALLAASKGVPYVCPVELDVKLPMIFVDDLMRGLISLQEAKEEQLIEPQHGYCVPGLSFTPNELFAEIQTHFPDFQVTVDLNKNMNDFAHFDEIMEQAEVDMNGITSFGELVEDRVDEAARDNAAAISERESRVEEEAREESAHPAAHIVDTNGTFNQISNNK